jgi:hypothetical protein
MYLYYEVNPSKSQSLVALALHCLALATIFFYVDSILLKYAGVAGIAVSAWCGYRHLIQQENIHLRVDPLQRQVEFRQSDQTYIFCKYKVYQTRWFAILKLIDQQQDKVLILNSDCFNSVESYRSFRFDLRQLERTDAA